MPSIRDKLSESKFHLVCASEICGFRVHSDYFEEKREKFAPGICPRCASSIRIVTPFTDDTAEGATLDLRSGQVIS